MENISRGLIKIFIVGSNGDKEFTRKVLEVTDDVSEVYLSVLDKKYSSGRPKVKNLTPEDLSDHVNIASNYDAEISVAFNSVCYSGLVTTRSFKKDFKNILERIWKNGVKKMIIAHPVLIRYAREILPDLHISLSSFNMVDSLKKTKYFANIGVNRIILAAELNRNPEKLKTIIENYPEIEFEVMVNNGCNYYCPFEYSHGSSQSHNHESTNVRFRYPYKCTSQIVEKPWKLLSSPFIRPEDLNYYEDIGVERFKLAGRNTEIRWMVNTLKAYRDEDFKGNIVDILNRTYSLSKYRNETARVKIDNKKLNDLLMKSIKWSGVNLLKKYKHYYKKKIKES